MAGVRRFFSAQKNNFLRRGEAAAERRPGRAGVLTRSPISSNEGKWDTSHGEPRKHSRRVPNKPAYPHRLPTAISERKRLRFSNGIQPTFFRVSCQRWMIAQPGQDHGRTIEGAKEWIQLPSRSFGTLAAAAASHSIKCQHRPQRHQLEAFTPSSWQRTGWAIKSIWRRVIIGSQPISIYSFLNACWVYSRSQTIFNRSAAQNEWLNAYQVPLCGKNLRL